MSKQLVDLEPKDMPSFLNELATKFINDDYELADKLMQCSMYIHTVNYMQEHSHKTRVK